MSKPKQYAVKNALVNYYLVLMFTVFPLFFTQQFSNIRHDKLNAFLLFTGVLVLAETLILLFTVLENRRLGIVPERRWFESLSFTDYAFFALILSNTLTTVFSEYPFDSFTGLQGRNNGLMLTLLYLFMYLAVSRNYVRKEYVFAAFALASLIVYALCILNFFYIDPLGMYSGYGEKVISDFTSTIGNKNVMSAFCCLTIPLFTMLFIRRSGGVRFLYLAAVGAGFASMLCADSESGFLGLFPAVALVLLYYIYKGKPSELRDFFVSLTAMFLCARLLIIPILAFGDADKGFGTMQSVFILNPLGLTLLFAAVVITAVLVYTGGKRPEAELPRAAFFVTLGVYIAALCGFVFLFIYYSCVDTSSKLGGIMTFFRFNEAWGTHRGFMWIHGWESFWSSGFKNILLGTGLDTFYGAFMPFFGELEERFGDASTNCAHNEFLNYLVTTGILGLGAYLALFVSAIVRAVKRGGEALVFIAPVICYLFQSSVNLATPIVTPLLFVMLALSEACVREKFCK